MGSPGRAVSVGWMFRFLRVISWVRVAELGSDTLTTCERSVQASAIGARRVETPGRAWHGGSMQCTRARPALPETHRTVSPHIHIPTNPQSLDPDITPLWKYDDPHIRNCINPQNRHPSFPRRPGPAQARKRPLAEVHFSHYILSEGSCTRMRLPPAGLCGIGFQHEHEIKSRTSRQSMQVVSVVSWSMPRPKPLYQPPIP
jgi:hypothetical protein